ncbi:hypothetical protein Gotur_002983 [Gossypium turneri]
MDLANDYYLKKFKSKDDYSQDFLTLQHHPNQVVVWIRLPDLSGAWYKRSLLHAIAKLVAMETTKGLKADAVHSLECGCDDPSVSEYWLLNIQKVFKELQCSPEEKPTSATLS